VIFVEINVVVRCKECGEDLDAHYNDSGGDGSGVEVVATVGLCECVEETFLEWIDELEGEELEKLVKKLQRKLAHENTD
jgi:hypothetical protein